MAKWETVVSAIGHYKILITIVIGVLVCGVLCDTSVVTLIHLNDTRSNLEKELQHYREEEKQAQQQLDALQNSPAAVERIAREQYFMKHSDEDVFVLKDDGNLIGNEEETHGAR